MQSTVYSYASNQEMREAMLSGEPVFYMRSGNPTVRAVARELAALEGSEAALLFGSGMAATSAALMETLRAGDHVVVHREVFSQTRSLIDSVLGKFGVDASYVDASDLEGLRRALRPNTALVYVETPSNPELDVVDLKAVAAAAGERGLPLFVDGTVATPALQNPLAQGAELVLHSATKYLAGHADVLCGVVCGSQQRLARIHALQKLTGGVLDPHAAFLLGRGLQTLLLRMDRICETALRLAAFLDSRADVLGVRYPFLDSHPRVQTARAQMRGGGGLISFELPGGLEPARRFVDALAVVRLATSLGGTRSTIEIPYDLKRNRADVEPGMARIRLSVGLEDPRLLETDLEQALDAAAASLPTTGSA